MLRGRAIFSHVQGRSDLLDVLRQRLGLQPAVREGLDLDQPRVVKGIETAEHSQLLAVFPVVEQHPPPVERPSELFLDFVVSE